ncbi:MULTISPECIES: TadE/TadG family type IV pilus assembly protein [unclassified Streptomyces]|jgi:Flp pilus assembly protein TadG|uniref:TadE/TadG family type IV pilus assembly protein n=1 Tax=unclassified Streptomyces TaxID=2593676 RepID=UPI000889DC43|nr:MULTISPECIES: TadE/TadG family type IV pilus assembly protein [unclassified Streptomyces]MDX2727603.1 TadE/TadG family type IV pilus assembly protein [Streptomyces sp. PA03-2a]MDX3764906.1 TadE/TadG family type IV pilus assembly protein [Streptomyces sp. AK08-01B]MDX3814485.1 TadE/TadG family type IV pilus assembly protein [Streptomyces sp. AK08-01A]SCY58295.1 TadE-like protein [Streptomyces sp. 136MFCol5.1]SFS64727.1 TadE-like protein [Streptomyces sp. ok210]
MSESTGTSRRDRGQVAIEYMGFIPLLLLVGLLAIQLGVAAYTANQAGTGARAAARTASHDMPLTLPEKAGRDAMSDWLADDSLFIPSYGIDEVTYTARVKIPSVVPGLSWGYANRSSTFPRE